MIEPSMAGESRAEDEVCFWSLSRLLEAFQHGELSRAEAVQACQAQAAMHDERLGAFIATYWESARRAANRLSGDPKGVLEGVPFSLKDNIDVQGLPTTCHSMSRRDAIASDNSDVADSLRNAGAILVGKNSLHELATGGPSLDLPWPPARNPWNSDLHPGGSSSGSGVAVASGMAYFSLGTDTGGSVRHPASACGVYGFKPSYGAVSTRGIVPLSKSCDHVGVLTRSAVDLPHLMRAISTSSVQAHAYRIPAAGSTMNGLRGLVVGVIDEFSDDPGGVDPAFATALEALIRGLASEGAAIRKVTVPPLGRFIACSKSIVYGEAYAYHGLEIDLHPSMFGQRTRDRIGQGRSLAASDYILAKQEQDELRSSLSEALDEVDVAVSLSSFGFPCRIDDPVAIRASYDRQARVPFSLTGLPSASIPVGVNGTGLPIGLSVSAGLGRDVGLVAALIAIEHAGLSGYRVPLTVRSSQGKGSSSI
ncbi:amidase [Pigmentiphaga kullae]|uniref:Aspartyl-tRNA(Asn)/glutamyl-tRNA(Gln) amidotransferase subunit A n=1 Tax=Pigmentiphaga kullae TaxID=151784 RepID=A0A4Q7NNK8_9BURK|nr:amidase [Pigmentiphaga kullae]RZS86662.1 aspartyl-tRNA(Asn)/glutamyl-tRNA(Gln) amidotransferase subunit A [Pigmentiphaga kullae]